MPSSHSAILVAVMSAVTILLRFLPFLKGDLRDAVPEHSRKLRAVFQSFFLQC